MSGLFTAIGRVFTPVIDGISHIGSAMTGVGATAFTGAAATGASSFVDAASNIGSSLFSGASAAGSTSTVLGNIFKGITSTLGGATDSLGNMLVGGAGSNTLGGSAAKGLGVGITPGGSIDTLTTAATPTGVAPTGVTNFGDKITDFLSSEGGGNLLAGLGKGLSTYQEQQAQVERDQMLYDFKNGQEQRLRESYHVDPSVFAGNDQAPPDRTKRPTPGQKYDRTRLRYVRGKGVVEVPA